jgi:hypothetical protein
VLAEGGDDVGVAGLGEEVVDGFGDPPGAGVGAGEVGREQENPIKLVNVEALFGLVQQSLAHLLDFGPFN